MICLRVAFLCLSLLLIASNSQLYCQSESESSDQQILEFDLAGYGDKGERTWEVKGESADIFDEVVKLKNVNANIYGEDPVNLTSNRGNYNKDLGQIHLEDDVVITTQSGAKMLTDSLDYAQDTKLITTEDKVDITKENINAKAKGLKAMPDLNEVRLNEEARVEIKKNDSSVTTITCQGPLVIEYEKQIATFNNDVKVVDNEGTMFADKMTVYLNFETKEIHKIVCVGNVKILKGQNETFSDEATYLAQEKKLILTGKPKLVLYSDEGMDAFTGD